MTRSRTAHVKDGLLDFADLNLECLLRLLEAVERRKDDDILIASARIHVILLLHILTPVLTEKTCHAGHRLASNKFLKLLCAFIDREPDLDQAMEDGDKKHSVRECERRIATMTLTDGAAVFFPDKEARRKQLFSMMTTTNNFSNSTTADQDEGRRRSFFRMSEMFR